MCAVFVWGSGKKAPMTLLKGIDARRRLALVRQRGERGRRRVNVRRDLGIKVEKGEVLVCVRNRANY